jgi:hypothetical protein
MTDMVVFSPFNDGYDIHTKDKKACSGYNATSYPYQALKLVIRHFFSRYTEDWNERCYEQYKRGYTPITPVFLVRWSDE